jgi:hypothetical protein
MENKEVGPEQKSTLPSVEDAPWPKEFADPIATAEKFIAILEKLGVET